jgi:hypothetical protein
VRAQSNEIIDSLALSMGQDGQGKSPADNICRHAVPHIAEANEPHALHFARFRQSILSRHFVSGRVQ